MLTTLSIVIPTYNRSEYLRRCLKSIYVAANNMLDRISVTVLDNCSTDDTSLVITDVQSLPSFNIDYIRHPINTGPEANLLCAYKCTNSDYILVLGDDDYLLPTFFDQVLPHLDSQSPIALKFDALEDRSDSHSTFSATCISHKYDPSVVSRYSFNDALVIFGLGLGNISTLILKSSFVRDNIWRFRLAKSNSGYPHLLMIYGGLKECEVLLHYYAKPLAVIRIEISPRDVEASNVITNLKSIYETLLSFGYDGNVLNASYQKVVDATIIGSIKCKKWNNTFSGTLLIETLSALSASKDRFKVIIIYLLPAKVYRLIWRILAK